MKKSKMLIAVFAVVSAVSASRAEPIHVDFDGNREIRNESRILDILKKAAADFKVEPHAEAVSISISNADKGYVAGFPENPVQWVTVDGGKFIMGTDDFTSGFEDAKPIHEVTVQTFEMSKTLVTVEQYAECVALGKCKPPKTGDYCNWGVADRKTHPVNCVTWDRAIQYAKFKGARLPSEAEWEYAATSGGKSQKYPWGNSDPTADLVVMSTSGTLPVCSRPRGNTAQGLCDMSGNLYQWMQDSYRDSYVGAPTDGSALENHSARVIRGGYFRNFSAEKLRADHRASETYPESADYSYLGFRLARRAQTDWVSIPGGKLVMGTNGFTTGFEDTKPAHEVVIKDFKMSKTDVTVEQYAECVSAGKCAAPGAGGNCNWGVTDRQKHPVNCVDWNQANQYAEFKGARLPSEAEWEYAARGGGKDYNYPWGETLPTNELAVMNSKGTMPVCSRPAGNSRQGLCDMAGNVYQWVQDKYQNSYAGAPVDGTAFEAGGPLRVLRGSPFSVDNESLLRVAYRYSTAPGYRYDFIGFRLAKSR